MKKVVLLAASAIVLAGCAQTSASGSCNSAQEFFLGRDCRGEEIQRAMSACETRKKWVDKMQCKQSVPIRDPLDAEINAYIGVLIEKVNAHKMTEAQAQYAFQQKVSEVEQRLDQANAESRQLNLIERQQDMQNAQERARQQNQINQQNADRLLRDRPQYAPPATAPAYQSIQTTHCTPDGSGGVNCTTY